MALRVPAERPWWLLVLVVPRDTNAADWPNVEDDACINGVARNRAEGAAVRRNGAVVANHEILVFAEAHCGKRRRSNVVRRPPVNIDPPLLPFDGVARKPNDT